MSDPDWNAMMLRVASTQDRAAFQALFAHFAPRLKAFLMRQRIAGPAAEELAQEALLIVWRKAHLFDPAKASASTWLFTVARNLRIDFLRRENRPALDASDPAFAPVAELSADDSMAQGEAEEALRKALVLLPPDQAQIVNLSFFAGHPHSQIALDLNIPLGTVKSRLRLAMARLRSAMGEGA